MSEVAVTTALYTRLDTLTPALPTAKPNDSFKPTVNTPWQHASVVFEPTQNPTLGDGFHRLVGFMQVLLAYPLGQGEGPAVARAQLLKALFKRGTTMTAAGVTVKIQRTPHMAAGYESDGFWKTPVTIRFWADITS